MIPIPALTETVVMLALSVMLACAIRDVFRKK
jgi:hypothetical protein